MASLSYPPSVQTATMLPPQTPPRRTHPVAPDAPRRRGWEVLYDRRDGTWIQVAGETVPADKEVKNLMASFDRMGDPFATTRNLSEPLEGDECEEEEPVLPILEAQPPFEHILVFRPLHGSDIQEIVCDRHGREVFNQPYHGNLETKSPTPESNKFYHDFAYLQDDDGNQLTLTGQRVKHFWSFEACRVIHNLCGRRAWELYNKKELPLYHDETHEEILEGISSYPHFRQAKIIYHTETLKGNTGNLCPTGIKPAYGSSVDYILLPLGLTHYERCQAFHLGFFPWLERALCYTSALSGVV
jgi:hypothetical protein